MIDALQNDRKIGIAGLQRFLRRAQREAELPGEVNVRITSDSEMRRLSRRYRGKDKATDVLSFPPLQNGTKRLAGDIAISADIARANSRELGHSFDDEVKILLLHGLLHLAGHDHESDNGEMSRLEQKLRAKLKLPTGLIERAKSKGPTAAPGRIFRKTSKMPTVWNAANGLRKSDTLRRNKSLSNATKNPAEGGRRSFRSVRSVRTS